MTRRVSNPGTPVRVGKTWVFPNGRVVPVVSGGDPTANPNEPVVVVQDPPKAPETRVFTEDEVNAIRREEKDKLYTDLEAAKEAAAAAKARADEIAAQMEELRQAREAQTDEAAAQAAAEEAERRAREEAEMEARELIARKESEWNDRFTKAQTEWENQFTEIQQRAAAQEATLEKERAFAALESYKQQLIAQHADDIMPQLVGLVTGNTQEEIDASISSAMQMTSDIIADMSQATSLQRGPRGVPATGASPTGPVENQTEQHHLTGDDIRNMTMEQYAQYRPQLLAQARPQR